jgi:AcrR family transcriptional regulator
MIAAKVRPGRPRNPLIDDAVFKAGFEAFVERGYYQTSLSEIARRAGFRTPAIYRRWPSKAALALDIVARESAADALPDTGSIRDDLVELLKQRLRIWSTPLFSRVLVPVIMEASTDSATLELLRRTLVEYRQEHIEARIRRAVVAGQLRRDTDPNRLMNQLMGAVSEPLLFLLDLPDESEAPAIVDQLLDGFAARD